MDFALSSAYIDALTHGQHATTVCDFRAIHDKDRGVPGHNMRGTLAGVWQSLQDYNANGYGIFVVVNQLDGVARDLPNVQAVRAHFVDLDKLNALEMLAHADNWYPAPSFAVQSSPGKAHVYWKVNPYRDNERFTLVQRKLAQFFDGDRSIIDATRIMRLPGSYHHKGEPQLVQVWALSGFQYCNPVETLETALSHVNVIDSIGARTPLGDPEQAAPSLEWVQYALDNCDPNSMDRTEWLSMSAAIKQAGWSRTDEATLFQMWSNWCARYADNDPAENLKQWNSIRDSQVGWKSISYRVPAVRAHRLFDKPRTAPNANAQPAQAVPGSPATPGPVGASSPVPAAFGEMLTDAEQAQYFAGCAWVAETGKIMTPQGRMMNATQFNGTYGGKKFIITETGTTTDEPWKAATRSTLWTVPKVDHTRFLPHRENGHIETDELNRKGINTYIRPIIKSEPGDVSLFLRHMELILPVESDRKILLDYMAHNAKFPGYKIAWAPLIQSAEGVGKGVLKAIFKHMASGPYFHSPNAQELAESGAKFNAWMRAKTFILVDEIRVNEKRDMIEVLKPMISEKEIEVQGKGDDQKKEDNYSNWAFFSNFKDAIPIKKNGRRFAIFYSAIQSVYDLAHYNMGEDYFDTLYDWLDEDGERGGLKAIAHYLLNYPIEKGKIAKRAPVTSSTTEALQHSLTGAEKILQDAIADQKPGFLGGYVSTVALEKEIKAANIGRIPGHNAMRTMLEEIGFRFIGKSARGFFAEDMGRKPEIYANFNGALVENYGRVQGYGDT